MHKSKGFTLVEIAVSLLIITVTAVAAFSLIYSAKRTAEKTNDTVFAANLCNNSVQIFISCANQSKNIDDMCSLLNDCINQSLNLTIPAFKDNKTEIYFDENYNQIGDSAKAYMICKFSITDCKPFAKMEIAVSKNKIIYAASYEAMLKE